MRFPVPARILGSCMAVLTLAACEGGSAPNTYAAMSQGVGFGDYQRHLRERESQGRSNVPYSIPPETRAPAAAPAVDTSTGPLPLGPVSVIPATPSPAASAAQPVAQGSGSSTVSDAQTYQPIPFGQRPEGAEIPPSGTTEIVHVTSVPTGEAASGPNVMAYALQTRHAVGSAQHRRMNPLRWSRWENACLQFPNQDAAQEAFLATGGPERDPQNLDPDGDGFACWWDPAVYRQAAAIGE